jgi:hypothetical protein
MLNWDIKNRVCEGGEADQAIEQRLRESRALHIETVGQGEGDRGG